MGTKIINLPPADSVTSEAYIPISQDITGNNRNTYKITAQQLAAYIGQTNSTGTVNRVEMSSSDSSLVVSGSPIITKGVIDIKLNTVTLDKLASGGATDGQVLTYDYVNHVWKPIDSVNTGVTADSVQIGTILWFAASSTPTGYLACSGQSVKKSDYTELWFTIGALYGSVNSNEFTIPDLRDELVKGWKTPRAFGSEETLTVGTGSSTVKNLALLPCIKALKTVQTTANVLNYIPKPSNPTDGKILTYQDSTHTWVASSAPASPTSNNPFSSKAWVNFDATRDVNGLLTTANTNRYIRSSFNVSSVLKTGTGDYVITFTTPMTSADYCVLASAGNADKTPLFCMPSYLRAPLPESVQLTVATYAIVGKDCFYNNLTIFG
jgi:microcystin-dependent protein